MKSRIVLFAVTLAMLAGLYVVSTTNLLIKESQTEVYAISVLVPNENSDCWVNFRKGMEAAAIEFNADISFVTLYRRDQKTQQQEMLLRELQNGAQALIVCPADSGDMSEFLKANRVDVPVISLYSELSASQAKVHIGADSFNMGLRLAEAVAEDMGEYPVTEVIAASSGGGRTDIDDAYLGLSEGLKSFGAHVRRTEISYETDVENLLREISPKSGQAVVTLDSAATQLVAEQASGLGFDPPAFYGVGCTNSVLRSLEDGAVRAVAVINDYDVGYLSVKTAADILSHAGYDERHIVKDALVRGADMYERGNETMLFPIE